MAREWFYKPGDNWLLDDLSGFKIRRTRSRTIPGGQTGGAVVSPKRWEPQQPQDFVRGVVDDQAAPLVRSRQKNNFVILGTWISAPSPRGSVTFTVEDPAGFAVGMVLQIMLDSGENFIARLVAIDGDVFRICAGLPASVGTLYGDPIENSVLLISDSAYEIALANVGVADSTNYQISGPLQLPASFRYALISWWFEVDPADGNGYYLWLNATPGGNTAGIQITVFPNGAFEIVVGDGQQHGSAGQIGLLDFGLSLTAGARYNLLISIDSVGQVIQAYLNDSALTAVSTEWDGAAPMGSASPVTALIGTVSFLGDREYCVGDVYASSTASFFDLSVTANRRMFIDATGEPVDLCAGAAAPTGVSPQLYLSIRTPGQPADLLINRGTGGGALSAGGAIPPLCAG